MIYLLKTLFFTITAIFQVIIMIPLIAGMVVSLASFCIFGTACLVFVGDFEKIIPLWKQCFTKAVFKQNVKK